MSITSKLEMPTYTCEKCARTFSQKSHYLAHQNKKNDCGSTTAVKELAQKIVETEKKVIKFNDFMKEKAIPYVDTVHSFVDATIHMAYTSTNSISYDEKIELSLFNVDALKVESDKYIFTYPLHAFAQSDIITDIKVSSSISSDHMKTMILIDNTIECDLEHVTELVMIAIPYSNTRVKFLFSEKPKPDDRITIHYRNYLLPSIDRKYLRSVKVLTGLLTYENERVQLNDEPYIIYRNFIEKKNIIHTLDPVPLILDNKAIVSFDHSEKLSLFNVDALKVEENTYSFTYYFQPNYNSTLSIDIIDNISVSSTNNKMKTSLIFKPLFICDLHKVTELVFCAMRNSSLQLKFTFLERPQPEDEIVIHYRAMMVPDEDLKYLHSKVLLTDLITYQDDWVRNVHTTYPYGVPKITENFGNKDENKDD